MLGHIYWRMKDLEMAISSFRKATELAPRSERASVGLFHCLWEEGKQDEAIDEAKRFMTLSDSQDFREILEEIESS